MRSMGRKRPQEDKNSLCSWSGMGVRRKGSSELSVVPTAGKENIAPQPQTPHGAVPLALTPPGKVRRTWALGE